MTIYKRRKGEAYLLTNSAIPVYTILSDLSVFLIIQSSVGLIRVPVNACFHYTVVKVLTKTTRNGRTRSPVF